MPRKCFPEALHDSSLFKVFSVAFYLISINIAFNSVFSSLLLQVTIIEASERIGGRILTYRNETEGWYAELGAMRIPSFHQ